MSQKQLDNLVRIGQLKAEPPAESECQGLLCSGLRRLEDAGRKELSLESRFDLAYNAAHALSLAALRYRGYRSESRYLVFQCLQQTIDLTNEQWRYRFQGMPSVGSRMGVDLRGMTVQGHGKLSGLLSGGRA